MPGGRNQTAARGKKIRGVMDMIFRRYLDDIREKTAGMSTGQKISYVITYYWYHILIIVSIAALIFFTVRFYLYGNQKPAFTCVIVNQEMDSERDSRIAEAFAEENGLDPERVTVDSDFVFSYGDVKLQAVNESSYEKFFLKWQNQEIDAIVLSESMYEFCREMRGGFRSLDGMDPSGLETYTDEGNVTAVVLGQDRFMEAAVGATDEKLLLAFPDNGQHEDLCGPFLECMKQYCEEFGGSER